MVSGLMLGLTLSLGFVGVAAASEENQVRVAGGQSPQASLDHVERQHILSVLKSTQWRISGPDGAAKILGLNPSTLRFRMKKHRIVRNHNE
jgi:transcriptional regulator with GAF, ATPase, and Fis domain